jgi:tRNA U54 and U55 pseudouridine synthase Pus10
MERKDSEKVLKELFELEQELGIPLKDRFHNSEEGKKQYNALIESKPSISDSQHEKTIEELTAKLERYKRGDFS